jgi:hypothetical protein
MAIKTIDSNDPKAHARNVGRALDELVNHLREDIQRFREPKAQALFETGAEVLMGLRKAFEHYETSAEPAMR